MNPEVWLRRILLNIVVSIIIGAFSGAIVEMSKASDWATTAFGAVAIGLFAVLELLHWADLIQVRG